MENQVVGHAGAVAAWEWRMLNSLAILVWLRIFLRNALAAGPCAPLDRANAMKRKLRSWMDFAICGTRLFCISVSLRRASVREWAFSDLEARYERAKRL